MTPLKLTLIGIVVYLASSLLHSVWLGLLAMLVMLTGVVWGFIGLVFPSMR